MTQSSPIWPSLLCVAHKTDCPQKKKRKKKKKNRLPPPQVPSSPAAPLPTRRLGPWCCCCSRSLLPKQHSPASASRRDGVAVESAVRRSVARQPGPGLRGRRSGPISGLPDDLLLGVLVRLRCARAAARASLLSRRWRGLWRRLPELTFRDVAPDALRAALAQVARTDLSLLDIDVPERHRFSPASVSSLLRTAANLTPAELRLVVWGLSKDRLIAVEVPCFRRATSIRLGVWNLRLALPEQGAGFAFPLLERLATDGCNFDFASLISRRPRLRVLEACHNGGLGNVKVHSPTIEDLRVEGVGFGGIDIAAPLLKKFTLSTHTAKDLRVSFLAPMVESVDWNVQFFPFLVVIGVRWTVRRLCLQLVEDVYLLSLDIEFLDFNWTIPGGDLKQKLSQLPNFSILKLSIDTLEHVSGAVLLNVLEACSAVKRLTMFLGKLENGDPCPPNCPCDQNNNWRNQSISLAALEEVQIEGFVPFDHEVDFLKLLIRCAPMLKLITVKLSDKVLPCSSGCKQIYDILKACPSLKWSFSGKCIHELRPAPRFHLNLFDDDW